MSQEQPPVRSRRELRQARDEKQANGSTGPGPVSPASKQAAQSSAARQPGTPVASGTQDPAAPAAREDTGRVRRVAESPVDSVAASTHTQRSSQIRARDRAALRAIKELEVKEGQLAAGGPPTRRQLRLQQLKEQALTSAIPVIGPPPAEAAGKNAPPAKPPAGPRPAPPSEPQPLAVTDSSRVPNGMSVEQALAARSLIAEQARNQLAKMEHIASMDPESVDPDILAEQIALAERAAVLNRRALAKQKLAEQAAPPAPATAAVQRPDPAAASNLAMVTPLEFVQVPGIDRPVMKRPATSHVPVVTEPGPKVRPTASNGRQPAGLRQAPGKDQPQPASGRSTVIARAEAAARAAAETSLPADAATQPASGQSDDLFDDLPRIPASSAYGLEPLDAATAGLARAKRMRIMQVCVLAFGIVALISGVMLIISGISR